MAIYHASHQTISRKAGRSSVAAAAYRAAVKLTDERTGQVHDYRRKRYVLASGLLGPQGVTAPTDRAVLWNQAEQADTRSNSTPAQEWEIALPHELTQTQNLALIEDIAQRLADADHCAVDWGYHKPHKRPVVVSEEGAKENHHVHILCTTREWTGDSLGQKCNSCVSGDDRAKRGLTTTKAEDFKATRAMIADCINRHLEKAGVDARVDHRSLKAQGIERAPQVHMGQNAVALERKGVKTRLGDINREIAQNAPQAKFEPSGGMSSPKPWEWEWTKPKPKAKPKKKLDSAKIKPKVPDLPPDLKTAISRDVLDVAVLWAEQHPRGKMSYSEYWDFARANADLMNNLDDAQKDLLASAVVDFANPDAHPTEDIKAAIERRYGPDAADYASKLEEQARSDASVMKDTKETMEEEEGY